MLQNIKNTLDNISHVFINQQLLTYTYGSVDTIHTAIYSSITIHWQYKDKYVLDIFKRFPSIHFRDLKQNYLHYTHSDVHNVKIIRIRS